MNGLEKEFENLSSGSEFFNTPTANAILLGEDPNRLYSFSDDQRYSNTVSSTSSTRSSSKNAKLNQKSILNPYISGTKAKTRSKSKSKISKLESLDCELGSGYFEDPNSPAAVARKSDLDMKRAINRYGTIPKGTQINAFLDSLEPQPPTSSESLLSEPKFNAGMLNFADMEHFNFDNLPKDDSEIGSLQSAGSLVPSLASPSNFQHVTTFSKDKQNVTIVDEPPKSAEEMSAAAGAAQRFHILRQKSDLTHSKTTENVTFGGVKGAKSSMRQPKSGRNHLQLLKSVAAPRLPSAGNEMVDGVGVDIADQFPTPPVEFDNRASLLANEQANLCKSGSFDLLSYRHDPVPINRNAGEVAANLVNLNQIISCEDFPPPPDGNELAADVVDAKVSPQEAEKSKLVKKHSKDDKKSKKENKEHVTNNKSDNKNSNDLKNQNSAFMSELYESFRAKAQKEASKQNESNNKEVKEDNKSGKEASKQTSKESKTNGTKSSFLFRRTTSKEPSCPAPAVPGVKNSKFYTKMTTESAGNTSVDAEYVTPVLRKGVVLKPIETTADKTETNEANKPTTAKDNNKGKQSKISMFFNGSKTNKAKQGAAAENNGREENVMTKSVLSSSGYEADDEARLSMTGSVAKKAFENQTLTEADSGIGSCSSSNAATSKSNDSVISIGSISSNTSARNNLNPLASPKFGQQRDRLSNTSIPFARKNNLNAGGTNGETNETEANTFSKPQYVF